jgi:hypothetical protein
MWVLDSADSCQGAVMDFCEYDTEPSCLLKKVEYLKNERFFPSQERACLIELVYFIHWWVSHSTHHVLWFQQPTWRLWGE